MSLPLERQVAQVADALGGVGRPQRQQRMFMADMLGVRRGGVAEEEEGGGGGRKRRGASGGIR
jgi:hypothetical protein